MMQIEYHECTLTVSIIQHWLENAPWFGWIFVGHQFELWIKRLANDTRQNAWRKSSGV